MRCKMELKIQNHENRIINLSYPFMLDSNLGYSAESELQELMPNQSPNSELKSSRQHRNILVSDVNELYAAKERLRDFSLEVGSIKNWKIRKDVLDHCDKFKNSLNQVLGFEKIERMVKNRIQKMIKNKRIKKNWSEEDILILIWIVSKYADWKELDNVEKNLVNFQRYPQNSDDWAFISTLIPGVQGESCMFKWLGLKKNNLSENSWSEKESSNLERLVRTYGETDWGLISQKLYYSNTSGNKIYRCPKQCRQHWNCYLNPQLKKGPWSSQEDALLLNSVLKNGGLKRWAEMVKLFNGRTENALKNRFTLIIQKQMKAHSHNKNMTELDFIKQYLNRTYVEQFVNIKSELEGEKSPIETKSRAKALKREYRDRARLRESRTSLRRRNTTIERCREDSFLSPVKIEEEQPSYQQIFYPATLEKEQFSEPCPFPLSNRYFQDDDDKFLKQENEQQNFPEIQTIKVVPLSKQMLENLKNSLMNGGVGQWGYVPCAVMENKLTKLNF